GSVKERTSESEGSGRRYQDAPVSGSRRYAFQPGKPVKGSRTGEQIPSGSGGDPESKKGFRRAAVSNSVFPDRRHPGRYERHQRGALQTGTQGVQEVDDGRIRKDCKALQSGGTEEDYRKRQTDHLPSGRSDRAAASA